MINGRVLLSLTGVACAAVLVAQLRAGGERPGAVPIDTAYADGVAGGCTPGIGPDVVIADLSGISKWGAVGTIAGYSIGTTSCNLGSQTLQWDADTNNHPVIGQNFYRYRDGRFEQIGMSWLKHGFSTSIQSLCCPCQNPNNSQVLGIGCSDPYGSPLNGDQDGMPACGGICGGLGPRYEVNATNGEYTYPYDTMGDAGDDIYKRLQVQLDDIDPALNAGALYWAEGHYVTPDDAASANHHNNASYEQFIVSVFQGDSWILVFTGDTTRELPAIYAWQDQDPAVVIEVIEDDGDALDDHDGRFHLGYRVTDNGDGTWHYEYALHNMNSHRSAKAFAVPVPGGVTLSNIGFHDVDYHSGDGEGGVTRNGTDWSVDTSGAQVRWFTDGFATDPNANALRWGTMYNFRFDADSPPTAANVSITPYRDGSPGSLPAPALGPVAPDPCPWDLDDDLVVGINDFLDLLAAWDSNPDGPPDFDNDGIVGITDMLEMLGRWGACPTQAACGSPAFGSCYEANGTPGCSDLDCCETVCATDQNCCDVAWDAGCKDLANTLCGNCGDPGAGDCCAPNGTPGCEDATCCRDVCVADPICCNSMWDAVCVMEADAICGCPLPVDIVIDNAGFEADVVADGDFTAAPPFGWTSGGGWGLFNPTAASFPDEAPEGDNVAYSNAGDLEQQLSDALLEDTTYTLQVEVGHRLDVGFATYTVELWAGTTLLAGESSLAPAAGSFETSTVQYDALLGDPAAGEPLIIRLTCGGIQVCFDDVRLQSQGM